MKFVYEKGELADVAKAQSNCFLHTNGLGGYMSCSVVFSVTRGDQGVLLAAKSPSKRENLVHRLSEKLNTGGETVWLSTQSFSDDTPSEDGYRRLSSFSWDGLPVWQYDYKGVRVTRRCALEYGANTAIVVYTVENQTVAPCSLRVTPVFQFAQKSCPPQSPQAVRYTDGVASRGDMTAYIKTTGSLSAIPLTYELLYYADDEKDGRAREGFGSICCEIEQTFSAGETGRLEIVFSNSSTDKTGAQILQDAVKRQAALLKQGGFSDPVAQELSRAADAFLATRSGVGKTVLAGFPFFGDWGRDTMISLPGCVLARGDYDTAKSILRTFLSYEKDGLVPNLFPEGELAPMYNTVDAALLLINDVWLYYERTNDVDFVREAYPVLERIAQGYQKGTHFSISMDQDGLIRAGEGLDQVTWMDARIGDMVPTPRHGKPVEINAYWYSALCILARLAPLAGSDGAEYAALAERVQKSFAEKFWIEEAGYLKDVLSGTKADTQVRCNQIWAVTMPFTMLSPKQERAVVDTVYRHLYTPYGLRTLSPEDTDFHPFYGGSQIERDQAYHQGTVWPFPLGAWYLAYLKVHGNTHEAAESVRHMMENLPAMLCEGCVGQLPEIYDGGKPGPSKGCFAQAWSVGETLRVWEKLEEILGDRESVVRE